MNIRSWCRIVNIRSASQPAAFRSERDWGAPSDLAHQEGGCCRSCIAGLAMDHVVQAWLKTALIGGSWRKPGRMVVASLSCSEIHRTRRLFAICHLPSAICHLPSAIAAPRIAAPRTAATRVAAPRPPSHCLPDSPPAPSLLLLRVTPAAPSPRSPLQPAQPPAAVGTTPPGAAPDPPAPRVAPGGRGAAAPAPAARGAGDRAAARG